MDEDSGLRAIFINIDGGTYVAIYGVHNRNVWTSKLLDHKFGGTNCTDYLIFFQLNESL